MLDEIDLYCPYCGEPIQLLVDASAGDHSYVEDCQVCCRPIVIGVSLGEEGEPIVSLRSENEA